MLLTESLDVGGMDMVVAFLARGLVRHGFSTSVAIVPKVGRPSGDTGGSEHRRTIARQLVDEGVRVVECTSEAELAAEVDHCSPAVASVHGPPDWALESLGAKGVPVVESLHGMHWLFEADLTSVRRRDELLSRVVSVSALLADQYIEACPQIAADKVVVIPNAVDPSRLAPVDRDLVRRRLGLGDEVLVVSLARHCLQKNTYGLVDAFVDVARAHPDVHLLVAGDPSEPEYVAQIQAQISSSGVAERIHLRDHCPDPAALLAAADAFVLDSFFEGWALSSMEALCHGVPVVLSDVAGAREQLTAEEPCGLLVLNPTGRPTGLDWEVLRSARYAAQTNRRDLVAALEVIVRDRDEWRSRRSAIAADARRRFGQERCLGRHAAVLLEAARVGSTGG